MRPTLLAADIVEAILNGHQPEDFGLSVLLKPFPLEWEFQRARFSTTCDLAAQAERHSPYAASSASREDDGDAGALMNQWCAP
jgi:hypothetical protein